MKKYIMIIPVLLIIIALLLTGCSAKEEGEKKDKIVTSFYPMYIIALNVMDGIENRTLENMTETTAGCLHNYTLQTSDLRKIEKASVFIENGLGLENFIGKIAKDYPNLKIIDTSNANIETIEDDEGINGHVWNKIDNYKKQIQYVAEELSKTDPENSKKYQENAQKYIEKVEEINTYKLENKQYAISCNEALTYILNDANLEIIECYTDHDQSSLSSWETAEIIEKARENNIKTIFVEKNDDLKNAQIIANETGAEIVTLDANLTGEFDKNSYIHATQQNFDKIRNIFEN